MSKSRQAGVTSTGAWSAGILLVGAAFLAASFTSQSGFLSLTPPPTALDPSPAPDTTPDRAVTLYQSAYTAWAALILTTPAMATVWFRLRSQEAARTWRLFWTVGFAAFFIHMLWSMGVFFEGDIDRMTSSSRVSAFWPGIIFLIWWMVDVALAWARFEDRVWITAQRTVLHIAAFILFVGGSLVQGETLPIKGLGAVFILATIGGMIRWISSRRLR